MEKKNNHVHAVKRIWEWPHYFCRVGRAFASPLPCQPDGEHDLTGDVLPYPVCYCSVCTLQCGILQRCLNTSTRLQNNAMSPVEMKRGRISEVLYVSMAVVRCHAMPRG